MSINSCTRGVFRSFSPMSSATVMLKKKSVRHQSPPSAIRMDQTPAAAPCTHPLGAAQYMRSRFRVESWNTGFPKTLQSLVISQNPSVSDFQPFD